MTRLVPALFLAGCGHVGAPAIPPADPVICATAKPIVFERGDLVLTDAHRARAGELANEVAVSALGSDTARLEVRDRAYEAVVIAIDETRLSDAAVEQALITSTALKVYCGKPATLPTALTAREPAPIRGWDGTTADDR